MNNIERQSSEQKPKGKIGEKVFHSLQKYKGKIIGSGISDKEFANAIIPKENYKDVVEFISYVKTNKLVAPFFEPNQKERIIHRIKSDYIDRKKNIVSTANSICEHKFDILTLKKIDFGLPEKSSEKVKYFSHDDEITYSPINWHSDPINNYVWKDKTYFLDIKENAKTFVEAKIPQTLSRFYHLTRLGQAYWLIKDEKYTIEYMNQTIDWIKHNKLGFGINWKNIDDVSIRLINWIIVYFFFRNSRRLEDVFVQEMLKSLYDMSTFIYDYLFQHSEDELKTHSYLVGLIALVFMGTFFPYFKASAEWKQYGVRELYNLIKEQILRDGSYFEASYSMHRLVLEVYLSLIIISRTHKIQLPEDINDYVEQMFSFVLYSIKPNGFAPQFGDNSEERLFKFSDRDPLDYSYLLCIAAVIFRDKKFKIDDFDFDEEVLWLMGEKAYEIFKYL